ncbi:DNA polymerase [Bovine gammaherpesvirus 6]|uniref:DNA polymerase n=9 Tax=Bovine gammaherpesvirus 6 TaxID=1504288 RepID=A0A060CY00_9GAMA|nr:DNA polymerase [Bovine gammaherpesvirus 6]AIB03166.1 DNA polymerase [Bovine gammaherpesvirus 6]
MSFWNPYLRGFKPGQKKAVETPKQSYSRIIPKCFKPNETSRDGVLTIETEVPPTGFYQQKEFLVFPEGKKSFWEREQPTYKPETSERISFHVYDIIETSYHTERCDEVPLHLQTDIIPTGIVLKLFGRDERNRSVCVNVFGQKVYFYVYGEDCSNLRRDVQHLLQDSGHRSSGFSISTVQKKFLTGYSTSYKDVYQVTMTSTAAMYCLAGKLQQQGYSVFEANVDAVARFITDNKFSTFGWYSCTGAVLRPSSYKDSNTSLEYDCRVCDMSFYPEKNYWPKYNVMAFDIECLGESGFPTASRDEDMVIQISCVIWQVGESEDKECILLTVGTCDPLPGITVYEFPSEMDMLYAFLALIRDRDIEFITGYNISNFDFQYVLDRASYTYNIKPESYTRTKSSTIFAVHKPRDGNFMRSHTKVKLAGVIVIDMYLVCKEKLNLSNYKLNTVAKECTGEKKEDVSYKEIPVLFKGTAQDRARLGLYCVQDSVLVIDLLKHFMTHVEISEIAKIANIPTRRVITDGQQIRVFSCLLAAAKNRNYILPMPSAGNTDGYQGATVINPLSGFYNTPVLVVDFASLYPSIIQAHNLCYSTMIEHDQLSRFPELKKADYETFVISSGPVHFVKKHKTESLLASLLTAWLAKRKAIRKELATCQDSKLKTILDKQQLAIKVTCNAVYGFTGVASGLLPCLKIAETVTLQGRTMLERTKHYVESLQPVDLERICQRPIAVAEGHADPSLRVVYGDTDSLFINCIGYDIETVLAFGDQLAEHTSNLLFNKPIKLESEKVFKCLLLLTKKRYLGILSNEKILMKGVDLVRKTACAYVQEVSREVLDLVLKDADVRAAAQTLSQRCISESYKRGLPLGFYKVIDVLNAAYAKLQCNQVKMHQLTYSTELSKEFSYYKSHNLPHLAVYKKMMARNEELPQVHDRIAYVLIQSNGSLVSDMAEDPVYAEQNHIPVASEWYFNKVVHSVANILQCLFKNDVNATIALLYNFVHTK